MGKLIAFMNNNHGKTKGIAGLEILKLSSFLFCRRGIMSIHCFRIYWIFWEPPFPLFSPFVIWCEYLTVITFFNCTLDNISDFQHIVLNNILFTDVSLMISTPFPTKEAPQVWTVAHTERRHRVHSDTRPPILLLHLTLWLQHCHHHFHTVLYSPPPPTKCPAAQSRPPQTQPTASTFLQLGAGVPASSRLTLACFDISTETL